MPTFVPSKYSYGDAASPAPQSGSEDYTQYMDLAREFIFGTDPRTEASVLKVQAEQAEAKAKSSVWPLKSYWESRAARLWAQYAAVTGQAKEQEEAKKTEILTRWLVVGLAGTGIVVGLSMIARNVMEARAAGTK